MGDWKGARLRVLETDSSQTPDGQAAPGNDVAFAVGIVVILTILFIPLPAFMIDLGLAFSIALSVLVLMVALWISRPLDFTAFPIVLLIATMLRLALNIATTRLILSQGYEGADAAGHVIAGFAGFIMGGDFVIGVIVFLILITVNFLVITKGATRIAEVGARFSLDAMPGKQMAIDADLSAGLVDEREARRRRREVEDESAFYGSMDGASKFVRGDAIAGLIITAINIVGGILIGVFRHGLPVDRSLDVFFRLSIGDGLVTQIPALIISLAAGLIVSKGGTRESADKAVFGQIGSQPRAVMIAGLVVAALGLAPGLPMGPFVLLSSALMALAVVTPARRAMARKLAEDDEAQRRAAAASESAGGKDISPPAQLELVFGTQLAGLLLHTGSEIAVRVARIRRKFALQYGFVIPEVKISDDHAIGPKSYQIKIHGTIIATGELRPGEVLVVYGSGRKPQFPGDEVRDPAFGMPALWIPEMFAVGLRQEGFAPVDNASVLLTHLAEVVRMNLAAVFSYKDLRALIERLDPDYRKLIDEICPNQISNSGLQAVMKALLMERVSIRNLHLIVEAVAEVAPFTRKIETIAEHVRSRIAQQICGDLADGTQLKVLRLSNRWEMAFHQALKKDAKGEIVEFDLDPRMVEAFSTECTTAVHALLDQGHRFAIVCAGETRPYVRLVVERLFPTISVISHAEIGRTAGLATLGTIT
ncbi:MAG TPA: flagellar biosynthesis protein FlhA [Hyphomicrobium sp.]|nr:flagellar biosynthesis protein FlhA [Hyphomicrobium sp.]